jgi:group I intron endonuclease
MIIYKFTNKINGKIYIGQTTNTFKKRYSGYSNFKGNTYFNRALLKYGMDGFITEEICSAKNLEDLNYLEEYFIEYYGSLRPNGYNTERGGNNHTRVVGAMKGKFHSEETKKKMSLSALGKPKSLEAVQKMIKSKTGSKMPREAVEKRAMAQIGKKKTGSAVICNETGESFMSVSEASSKTGVYRTKIVRQLTGKVKNTKCPLTFRYLNKEK